MLLGVLNLLLACHAPLTHGGDDGQVGRQQGRGHVEAHLVVAFAGAAVSHCTGADFVRRLHEQPRDQRAAQGGGQRVAAAVERAGLQRGPDELSDELLARVHDVGLGAHGARFGRARFQRHVAAKVGRQRHHLIALLAQPVDGHGSIEPARVGQDHLLPLLHVSLLSG